jgi:hypothetical protein
MRCSTTPYLPVLYSFRLHQGQNRPRAGLPFFHDGPCFEVLAGMGSAQRRPSVPIGRPIHPFGAISDPVVLGRRILFSLSYASGPATACLIQTGPEASPRPSGARRSLETNSRPSSPPPVSRMAYTHAGHNPDGFQCVDLSNGQVRWQVRPPREGKSPRPETREALHLDWGRSVLAIPGFLLVMLLRGQGVLVRADPGRYGPMGNPFPWIVQNGRTRPIRI